MDLKFDLSIAKKYTSKSQIVRVITENWVKNNGYCPNCGSQLFKFENNRPVADFLCKNCKEEFELKSKRCINISNKIVDGAYSTMMDRIMSENNPNFFFLTYDKIKWEVTNFLIIPKFFFIPNIIEKRKPLSINARRAGWIGCNINLLEIPENGRIYFIKDATVFPKVNVLDNWKKVSFLKEKRGESKGWIIEIMKCVDKIPRKEFNLIDVYQFESELKEKYPKNNFIKDKIRQQLQFMRDKGLIEFIGRGKYRKVKI